MIKINKIKDSIQLPFIKHYGLITQGFGLWHGPGYADAVVEPMLNKNIVKQPVARISFIYFFIW